MVNRKNLEKLDMIAELEDGWNGNGSKAFDKQYLIDIQAILNLLTGFLQPEIFPLPDGTIQIEYGASPYLEIHFARLDLWEMFLVDSNGNEEHYTLEGSTSKLLKKANEKLISLYKPVRVDLTREYEEVHWL